MKNRILVSILLLLCPFTLRAQTSYGRIHTDRISNEQIIIITGATPDVSNGNVFKTNNGAPTTITNFLGGVDSQIITVNCGETNTTIQNGSNLVTSTGSNITCALNKVYGFTYDVAQAKWIQSSIGATGNPGGGATDVQVNNGGAFGNIPTPTAPDGVPQTLVSTPSGGPTQATGLKWRIISAASDSVVPADRSPKILQFTNMGGTTETVPDVGSAGFTGNPAFSAQAMNGVTVTFNRTSTSTFTTCVGYNCVPGLTTFKLKQGQRAHFSSPDNANWLVQIERGEMVNVYNQYVSAVGGDDANDGWTYQSPKKTIFAALQALPGGSSTQSGYGTVFVGNGVSANPTVGAGIQLMGPGDPNYASPPAGWLKAPSNGQSLHIIGVGCAVCQVFSSGTGIWLSGTNNNIKFENLAFQYPFVVIRLGIQSNGTRNLTAGGVQNVHFKNVHGLVNSVLGAGPAVDIGSDNYFIYFDDSKFQGNMAFYSAAISTVSQSGFTETVNTTAANNFTTGMKCGLVQVANPALNFSAGSQTLGGITVVSSTQFKFARPENQSINSTGGYAVCDKGLPIVIDPGSGLGSGLLWFKDMFLNGGGIRLWSGTSNTVMYVDGVTIEGDFGVHQTGPGVWVGSIGTNGLVNVKNVFLADTLGHPIYNVINDSYSAGGHVLYEGCAAANCATGQPTGSGVHLIEPNYYFNSFVANDCIKTLDVAANFSDSGAPCFQQGKLPQAYDNFNRGNLGTNWAQVVSGRNAGTPTISSNQFSATSTSATTTIYEQAYTANPNPPNSTIGSNQWCEVTVTAITGGNTGRVGCGVRRTATTVFGTGYVCYESSSTAAISRMSRSQSDLTTIGVAGVPGDVIRCEANGSTITMYRNGVSILAATDSNYMTGQPSLYLFTSGVIGFTESGDNWSGGSIPGGFATLDAEQSFREPQHFNSVTIGPASPPGLPGALSQGTLYVTNLVLNGSNSLHAVSGNTGKVAQSSGTMTQTKLKTADASGNIVDTAGSGTLGITFPGKYFIPGALCNNATPSPAWNLPRSNAAAASCNTGTNVQEGGLDFADGQSAQYGLLLPSDWTGAIDARLTFFDASTSGTVTFQIATACTPTNGSIADESAFNTADSFATITLNATTKALWETTKTGLNITGCSAGNQLHIKISRTTDTAAAVARMVGLELTIRRAL